MRMREEISRQNAGADDLWCIHVCSLLSHLTANFTALPGSAVASLLNNSWWASSSGAGPRPSFVTVLPQSRQYLGLILLLQFAVLHCPSCRRGSALLSFAHRSCLRCKLAAGSLKVLAVEKHQ